MAEKVGIEQLKELVSFGVKLGNALGKALEDGQISLGDASAFFDAALAAPAAFDGIEKIPSELSDLDQAEAASLKAFVAEEFDIPEDNVEKVVESALDLAVQIFAFIQLFKSPAVE